MKRGCDAFRNQRVWVSGHTGFKGAWLCEWLLEKGAEIFGFALPAETPLFHQLGLETRLKESRYADIRDSRAVSEAIRSAAPHFVFHLAAQPLVRASYDKPVETYAVNVMGTVHVLEVLRTLESPCAAVLVTTDKCYENREWHHSYREDDVLGGHDPYSSSKAAAEIAISSYRRSYFDRPDSKAVIASARAGNVIGGGDWARDRIVPDAIRALSSGKPIEMRNPLATRPWQHVLEPVGGYLTLAAALSEARLQNNEARLKELGTGFNFGPALSSNQPVGSLVREIVRNWPGTWRDASDPTSPHEAKLLNLATDRAYHRLGWRSRWNFEETVRRTIAWYREEHRLGSPQGASNDLREWTRQQILDYQQAPNAATTQEIS